MNLTLEKTIQDNIVIITDTTEYGTVVREDFAGLFFLVNKKTTGNVVIPVDMGDVAVNNQWALVDLVDGVYEAHLLLLPLFSYVTGNSVNPTLSKGTVVYDDNVAKIYRAIDVVHKEGTQFTAPNITPEYWEELVPTDIYSVYDPTFIPVSNTPEKTHIGSIEFVYYNNLIAAYTKLAKEFANTSKSCGDYVDRLRKLRDKYEAVELASAAHNYLGVQLIIEASDNLLCNTSC